MSRHTILATLMLPLMASTDPTPPAPRPRVKGQERKWRMVPRDIGHSNGGAEIAAFHCPRCGEKADWMAWKHSDIKRHKLPACPVCNAKKGGAS